MILLDTSAAILLLRGEVPPAALGEESVGISTIVEMELLTGVHHGGGQRERDRVSQFCEEVEIFEFDRAAAASAAKVRAELWRNGTPIGDHDTLIAGHALALGLRLLTGNTKHYERVTGLQVLAWE